MEFRITNTSSLDHKLNDEYFKILKENGFDIKNRAFNCDEIICTFIEVNTIDELMKIIDLAKTGLVIGEGLSTEIEIYDSYRE